MITKIVPGGQTGADWAALDVAMEEGIPHGGWIPKGRKTEAGPLPERYQLTEMPTDSYPARTERNVIDSDGTVILSHGDLTGGSAATKELAMKHARPLLHIDLNKVNAFKAAETIATWAAEHGIRVVNVAGPRASKDPRIYEAVTKVLTTALHLDHIRTHMPAPERIHPYLPTNVDEALKVLMSKLPLREKTMIGHL
jgi:Circularly permutated YpsA SLOG family